MSYLRNFAKTLRASLSTAPSSSSSAFHLPIRKMVLRFSASNASSAGTRTYLLSPRFSELTKKYPSIEFVVDEARHDKHPLVTGFYTSTTSAFRNSTSKGSGSRESANKAWTGKPTFAPKQEGEKGKRKDVSLANLDANQVEQKVKLVLESSGDKIKSLKRNPVVPSATSQEGSARGIWSQFHDNPVNL